MHINVLLTNFNHLSHFRQGCFCTSPQNIPSTYQISSANICRNSVLVPETEFERFGIQTGTFNSREWRTNYGSSPSQMPVSHSKCNCFATVLNGRSIKSMNSNEFLALMAEIPHEDGCACVREAIDEFTKWSRLRKARKEHNTKSVNRNAQIDPKEANAFAFNLNQEAQARYWFAKYLNEDTEQCRSNTSGQSTPNKCRICHKSLKKKKNI